VAFIRELRRRRVIRFGGIYIVGAWLVFQIADVFFPAWGVPETALRYLLYAAVACFPLGLIFSWFFDVSTSGITRTPSAGLDDVIDIRLKRSDYLLLTALVVLAVAILYNSLEQVVESSGELPVESVIKERPLNSIAVLPFDNLDSDPDTGYFSDGVSEEILHRLSDTHALKVIGRTSSFAFGGADMGLNRISELLGVRYLLGGSVRRVGDQVRLTARLVDESGFQVWSGSFDGELKDIFALQDAIAEEVAGEITREVIILESPNQARTTENIEAYQQYLIGRKYFHSRTFGWHDKAAEAYRRSIEADPGYALPYASLAIAIKMGAKIDDPDSRWVRINQLIDRSMELHPDLPEGWMARGLTHTEEPGWDLDEDIEQLERAIELDPNLPTAYNFLAVALGWSGRREESAQVLKKGLEVDPLSPVMLINYANIFLAQGDFASWNQQMTNLLDLPDPPWDAFRILRDRHQQYGFLSESLRWADQGIRHVGEDEGNQLVALALIYERLGMPVEADLRLDRLRTLDLQDPFAEFLELSLATARGNPNASDLVESWRDSTEGLDFTDPDSPGAELAAKAMISNGDHAGGIEILEETVDLSSLVSEVADDLIDWNYFQRIHLLAFAYQQVGRMTDAETTLDYNSELFQLAKSVPYWQEHPERLMWPVLDRTAAGDLTAAAAALSIAVDAGWRDYHIEKNNPVWRNAWESDEFAPIVADILIDLERQRLEAELESAPE
jgi:TolB-like protein/tetratricopeptide (TPR) repeat protein